MQTNKTAGYSQKNFNNNKRKQHFYNPQNNSVNLFICGFMGTGKTTISKKLAKMLNMNFIDSDKYIEDKEKMSVNEIFEKKGETYFRNAEKLFVEESKNFSSTIIACGGGLVCNDEIIENIKKSSLIVCLYASSQEIYKRTSKNKNRPLLNTENPLLQIETLMAKRKKFYDKCGPLVLTGNRSVNDICEHIFRIYAHNKRKFAKLEK